MIGVAAGLTIGGQIPFTGTFANFSTGRVYDQIRQSVAYSDKNVKICASHAGLTLGEDGATHQILEDIGLMKMLPNMVVINPCDYNQTKAATLAIAKHHGPVYLRFGRPKVPNFTAPDQEFVIGKAINSFTGETGVLSRTTVMQGGVEMSVAIGRVLVDIAVSNNPLHEPTKANLPGFLERAAESIADKPVNPVRIYIGLAIFFGTAVVAGTLLYSGIRSGIISVGRNPLSKHSITKSIIQVVLMGMIILLLGVFAVYLLLRI